MYSGAAADPSQHVTQLSAPVALSSKAYPHAAHDASHAHASRATSASAAEKHPRRSGGAVASSASSSYARGPWAVWSVADSTSTEKLVSPVAERSSLPDTTTVPCSTSVAVPVASNVTVAVAPVQSTAVSAVSAAAAPSASAASPPVTLSTTTTEATPPLVRSSDVR